MSTVKKPSFWIGFVISVLIPCSSYALTTPVSINDSGIVGDQQSSAIAMTPDAKYVLFHSYATNLVANDTNGTSDVFVKNMLTNEITRVSVSSSGAQSDEASEPRAITPDGRYVLFDSAASNLTPSGSNGYWGVFVRDLVNNTTTRVSVSSGGEMGDGYAYSLAITPDGRYVLFQSNASNLVVGDTNGNQDIFVRDMVTNEVIRVSISSSGVEPDSYSQATAISDDGRYVLFSSYASTLDPTDNNWQNDVFMRDVVNNTTTRVSTNSNRTGSDGYSEASMMTPDGRYVSFYSYATDLVPDDTNGVYDVFVKDMSNGMIERVSVDSAGSEANSDSSNSIISPNGQYVVFDSPASNLVLDDTNGVYDVFVRDVVNNTTTRVSLGDDLLGMDSNIVGVSDDMRYVFFVSYDYDWYQHTFVRDLVNNTTSRVDITSNGDVANNSSSILRQLISSGGDYVGFSTYATNIAPNDSNGTTDVFVSQWKVILGAAPTIVSPSDGSYRNTNEIVVHGAGQSGADIRVTFLGNTFLTIVDANNEWILQLPDQLDASYTIYAEQKASGDSVWSATGSASFTIDTTSPTPPTIISPLHNATMSGGDLSVIGLGEPGGSVTVKVGNITKMVPIDGMGNWTAGPFTVVPGYQYAIIAKQSDIAGNQSPWSPPITIFGFKNSGQFSLSDYLAELFLIKNGVSDNTSSNFVTGSTIETVPNANIRYTLEYDNVGNGYASGTIVRETIPVNTCFTIGSISGLDQGAVVEFSNNQGATYTYIPVGNTGQNDCAVTDFRIRHVLPLSAKMNVVSDDFSGTRQSIDVGSQGLILQGLRFAISDAGPYSSLYKGAIGDLDADGDLDAVGFGYYGSPSVVYMNQGTGTFVDNYLPSYGDFRGGNLVDLDNDGDLDAVGYANTGPSKIYINQGDGTFVDSNLPGGGTSFVYGSEADLDADGDIDLIGYGYNGASTRVYINQGSGTFLNSNMPGGGTFFYDGDVADLDNDGDLDVVGYGMPGICKIYTNQGSGTFINSDLPGGSTSFIHGDVADLDTDGDMDIVGYGYGGAPTKLYTNQGSGTFTDSVFPGVASSFSIGNIADLDADGDMDVVGFTYAGLNKLYINQGSGTFIDSDLPGPTSSYSYGNIADLDSDGDIDIIGYGYNGYPTRFYANHGNMNFIGSDISGLNNNAFVDAPMGDLNGDGTLDIIGFEFNNVAKMIAVHPQVESGSYIATLQSTGNITSWSRIIVQEEFIAGQNKLEYSLYGATGSGACDTGNLLMPPVESVDGEIDISAVSGMNSSICVKVDFSVMTGSAGPVLRGLLGVWGNEDLNRITFDVKVKSGSFSGNTVTNAAHISSASLESTTGNNVDTHIFTGLPDNVPVGGFGGGEGGGGNGAGGGGVRGDAVETSVDSKSNSTEHEKRTEKTEYNNLTPQEIGTIIKELDATKPETPLVFAPPRQEISQTVEINTATPTSAIRDAITQTTSVGVGQTVEVKMITNPSLSTEKRCYTPKEVVDITLGQNTTNKDLLVYQALLKSYDLTIFTNTDSYMPDKGLKRYEAAKMFVNFAKHVLCREAKSVYVEGTYKDIKGIDETLLPYIKQAYEYGIMKGGNGAFRPIEKISRREFVAALMRMFMNQYLEETNKDRYQNYEDAFNAYGLDAIVGVDDEIDRYDMSKIMYKLYYNTSYQWTDKGYVLPYGRN